MHKAKITAKVKTNCLTHVLRYSATLDLLACLGLVILCLAIFWPIFTGHILIPAEGLFFVDPVFAQHRPADISPWQNILLVADLTGQIYPWRDFTAASLAAGRIPLWNPYSACGMPFLANNQSAVLNPTNFILNTLFAPPLAQTIFVMVTLLLAVVSTYGLIRSLGGAPLGAFLGGLTYAYSGFIFIWLGYPLAAAAALLPLLLWVTNRFSDKPSFMGAAFIGAIIGWQLLSGHVSTSVQILMFWVAFVVYELLRRRRFESRHWARSYVGMLAVGLILGSGLGASQLLPTKEYFNRSTISEQGRSRWSGASTRESIMRSLTGDSLFLRNIARGEVALLFNPEAHGHPAFQNYRQYPGYGNYAERTWYPGVLALLAIMVGLIRMPYSRPHRFFLIACWIIFAVLLHLPIANTLTFLPVLRLAAPQRMRFIFSLCAAISLGLMASDWLHVRGLNQRTRRGLLWILIAIGLVTGGVAVRTYLFTGSHLAKLPADLHALYLMKLFCPPVIAGVLIVVFMMAERKIRSRRLLLWALPVIAVLDVFVFSAKWHAFSHPRHVFPMLPDIKNMIAAADGGRVSGPAVAFRPNLSVAYKCYDVRSYDPISVSRYMSLVEAIYGIHEGSDPLISLGSAKPNRILEQLTSARVRWKQDEKGHVMLAPIRDAMPRAYIAQHGNVHSNQNALASVIDINDPWGKTVIEERPLGISFADRIVPAEISEYLPHRITVRASTKKPGWLVLTDTFFPGWHADVNGHEVTIAPANYAFRAVPIPAGESMVTFTYKPASYAVGLFLTCLSLCISTSLIAGQIVRGR